MKKVEPKLKELILRITKKRCSVRTLYCALCPKLSTRSQADLEFHNAKKHSLSQPKNVRRCQFCHLLFSSFSSLRYHKQKVYNVQSVSVTKNVDVTQFVGRIDDESLEEELEM